MISKIVILFLVFIAVLAMFGRLRVSNLTELLGKKRVKKCPRCGTHLVGRGPCACGHRKG